MSLRFEQNGRCYVPALRADWIDNNEWYVSLTFGNRHCDPLVGVELTARGHWVRRFGEWLYKRRAGLSHD